MTQRTSEERERAARERGHELWVGRGQYSTLFQPKFLYALCLESEQQKDEISALKARVEELENQHRELRNTKDLLKTLIAVCSTARKENTDDWMIYLRDEVNYRLLKLQDVDRIWYDPASGSFVAKRVIPPPSPIGEKG